MYSYMPNDCLLWCPHNMIHLTVYLLINLLTNFLHQMDVQSLTQYLFPTHFTNFKPNIIFSLHYLHLSGYLLTYYLFPHPLLIPDLLITHPLFLFICTQCFNISPLIILIIFYISLIFLFSYCPFLISYFIHMLLTNLISNLLACSLLIFICSPLIFILPIYFPYFLFSCPFLISHFILILFTNLFTNLLLYLALPF